MITKAFSVYDSKALCFGVPFFMPTVGGAVRAFSDLCNDAQSLVARHPSDFVLYEIGEYDDSKGRMMPVSPHLHLGIGSDFVEKRVPSRGGDGKGFPEITSSVIEAHDQVRKSFGSGGEK